MATYYSLVIRKALQMFSDKDKYAYMYGSDGEVMTDARVDYLWNRYSAHYEALGCTRQQLKDHVRGKKCFDCSSFINYVTSAGKDYYSATLWECCRVRTTPRDGVAGSLLYKPGHVALDVGYGLCLEFVNEFKDFQLNLILGRGFTGSGELPWVIYSGSSSD